MAKPDKDVMTLELEDDEGHRVCITAWYSGGGLVYYRISDGRRGTLDSRAYFLFDAGDLKCPSCGQDFEDQEEYAFKFGKRTFQLVCLLCDLLVEWSPEKERLVESAPSAP